MVLLQDALIYSPNIFLGLVFVLLAFSLSDFQSSGIYLGVELKYGSKVIFFPSTLC